jgi:hypothetical protein
MWLTASVAHQQWVRYLGRVHNAGEHGVDAVVRGLLVIRPLAYAGGMPAFATT